MNEKIKDAMLHLTASDGSAAFVRVGDIICITQIGCASLPLTRVGTAAYEFCVKETPEQVAAGIEQLRKKADWLEWDLWNRKREAELGEMLSAHYW